MGDGTGQVPSWFREGYIRDEYVEELQQRCQDSLLYTMVKPAVGVRVCAEIHATSNGTVLTHSLEGFVTAVGPLPSLAQLSSSASLAWELVSDPQFGIHDPEMKTAIIQRKFGTLHGHQINVVGWFADDKQLEKTMMTVVFEFDDNLFYPWKVIALRSLNMQEIGDLSISTLQQRATAAS